MTRSDSNSSRVDMSPDGASEWPEGTQALGRGLSLLRAVGEGCDTLNALVDRLGCTRSTTHRLASALVQMHWLSQDHSGAYQLGPKVAELGALARQEHPVLVLARPVLQSLGAATQDTVHLGIRMGERVLYLDKVDGQRGLEMRSRVGQSMPLALTGVGRALIMDDDEASWRHLYDVSGADPLQFKSWLDRMRHYRANRCVFDLEDNELGINCVAVPVRDVTGDIVAAISVASATPYLPLKRMAELVPVVQKAAETVSRHLGWKGGVI
ncbi:IclR family transcriptional regulator [Gluconobacter sp. LMG 1744]|nr:IclR family transcriptional regulator [Gluconobacter cadivus]MBF0892610.1 IclR family transcriptional regulator [Gluconobacter cadivus]